jgi:hypothetical protein
MFLKSFIDSFFANYVTGYFILFAFPVKINRISWLTLRSQAYLTSAWCHVVLCHGFRERSPVFVLWVEVHRGIPSRGVAWLCRYSRKVSSLPPGKTQWCNIPVIFPKIQNSLLWCLNSKTLNALLAWIEERVSILLNAKVSMLITGCLSSFT